METMVLDTNIIVRFLTEDDRILANKAEKIFIKAQNQKSLN